MAKILVTGSTGFIGKRLVLQLLDQGHEVWALSRVKGMGASSNPKLHYIFGDICDAEHMDAFPGDIEAAYYLVHSLGDVSANLVSMEEGAAFNFVNALEKTKCRQIIFLGGIIENEDTLSPHLLSRRAVEKALLKSRIPCTILRSSIIIGSGSASFEIIRDLVEKLPLMIAPKWVKCYCQPIAISDVLFYLSGVLLNEACYGKIYDIGGSEAFTFKDVLMRYAKFRKLKRYIIDVPVLTPRLSSYWLVLITSVRFSICQHLVESMKQNTRKINKAIDEVLPHQCLSYEEALFLAFQKIDQNEVISTWMDAWNPHKSNADIRDFIAVPKEGCLKDVKVVPITIPIDTALERVWSIGGKQGWYSMNWAWRLRGFFDQLIGGIGFNRGRRHPTQLEVGDSIDFWRVLLADKNKGQLILYAEMKVPGEAWLEFKINRDEKTLTQTATFRPRGVFGRLYWYMLFPFHTIIFKNMAKGIAQF